MPWLIALQDERLGRVVDTILDAPGDPYTVESLADIAAMSRSAFAEHFTASFGRLQHAGQLLEVGNKSIDEIARSVGYSSRSHFSQAFKDHSGPPSNTFRTQKYAV